MNVSREQLAAYADGELGAEERAEVSKALAADPELRKQLEAHRALKSALSAHYDPITDQAVPERLTAMLGNAPAETSAEEAPVEVLDFAKAKQQREERRRLPRWSYIAGPALAASLAIAVFLPRGGEDLPEGYADTQLASLLDTQLVSEQDGETATRVLLSFRNGEGEYCRAFSGSGGGGIACRDNQGWQLQALGEGSEGQPTQYRQASASDSALMALAQEMADGPALDANQEAAARDSDWQ